MNDKKEKIDAKQLNLLQRNYQDILEFIDKMEQVGQFQDHIEITSSIDHIWQVLTKHIESTLALEACALFLVQDQNREFELKCVTPPDKDDVFRAELDLQIECGTFAWTINRRQPSLIPSLAFKNEQTMVMLPLFTYKRTLGMVMIATPIQGSAVTLENLKLLTLLAKQTSLVLENTLLYEKLHLEHESLKKAQTQIILSEKLASIGRLASGAGHEILNPLQIISGHTQLLMMKSASDPKLLKYLEMLQKQSDRIAKIVKGLTQFSRDQGGSTAKLEINDVIEEITALIAFDAAYANVAVIKNLDPDLPMIMGDKAKLSQAFLNHMTNALDAMPGGGTLIIETHVVAKDIGLNGRSDYVEIIFQDSGKGIAEDLLDKIFDPFFTTSAVENRPGLGLAISYGIVQEHGGTIEVASIVGRGTTFSIYLPIGT
jgi:signal transduction histidine kinase